MINKEKSKSKKWKFKNYLLWFIICVIFVLAALPVKKIPETGLSDKVTHMIVFFALSILSLRVYPGIYLRSGLWLMLYGILIEGMQFWIPGRSCSLLDLAANLIGIAAGSMLTIIYDHNWKKRY